MIIQSRKVIFDETAKDLEKRKEFEDQVVSLRLNLIGPMIFRDCGKWTEFGENVLSCGIHQI